MEHHTVRTTISHGASPLLSRSSLVSSLSSAPSSYPSPRAGCCLETGTKKVKPSFPRYMVSLKIMKKYSCKRPSSWTALQPRDKKAARLHTRPSSQMARHSISAAWFLGAHHSSFSRSAVATRLYIIARFYFKPHLAQTTHLRCYWVE